MFKPIKIPLLIILFACNAKEQTDVQFPEGGYIYSNKTDSDKEEFYFDPIKAQLTQKDSVLIAFYAPFYYKSFDEPNISLVPPQRPIIRLHFSSGFLGYAAILKLTESGIIAKEIKSGYPAPDLDEMQLDQIERKHLNMLRRGLLPYEYKAEFGRTNYYDSLIKKYPRLIESSYYLELLSKASIDKESFSFRTWEVPIGKTTYDSIVNLINISGFWKLRYQDDKCVGESTHPDSYILEIATPDKYQVVNHTQCYGDHSFDKACKALIHAGQLDESFNRYQDKIKAKYR